MLQLRAAWYKILRYPVLVLLPVALSLVWVVPMTLLVPGVGMPVLTAGVSMLMFVALFAAPAVAGGYNAMVGAAAAGGVPSLAAFREGWGRYYWRIFGGAILMALVFGIFAFPYMRDFMSGQAPPAFSAYGVVSAALSLFAHVWLAALVTTNQGVLDTTVAAGRSLVARFVEYVPLLAVALVVYVIPFSPGGAGMGGAGSPSSIALWFTPATAFWSLLSSAVREAVLAFVRVGVFMVCMGTVAPYPPEVR